MPDQLLPFSPLIVSLLILWITAMALLLAFDLRRMRQSKQCFAWRERPMIWFAISGIAFSLGLMSPTLVGGRLSNFLEGAIIFAPLILFAASLAGGLAAILRPVLKKNTLNVEMRLKQLNASSLSSGAKSRPVENQTVLMMIGAALFLTMLALLDLISFYTHLTQQQFILAEVMVLLLFLLLVLLRLLAQRRSIKRLNQRRMMLATERRRLASSERISSEPVQLLLPRLVLRLKWLLINCYLVLFLAIVLLFWLSLKNFANSFSTIYFLYLLPLHLVFKLLFSLREQVEATTDGLVVTRGTMLVQQKQQMPWQEARLFTCYQIPGFLGNRAMMTYELASPGRVVQWTRVLDSHSLLTPWKTQLSAEEYSQQTQALCACITAKTGLELHNLSEEISNVREQEMTIASQSNAKVHL